jgi:hypothetical protein
MHMLFVRVEEGKRDIPLYNRLHIQSFSQIQGEMEAASQEWFPRALDLV